MNKAFIAICFWQSLPDLPPLGRHVPLTAFYRLVKAKYIFYYCFPQLRVVFGALVD